MMRNLIFFYTLLTTLIFSPLSAQSLFDDSTYKGLVTDPRSYEIGQILTVLIYESATASSSTDAATDKATSFGLTANNGSNQESANLGINSDFNGGGTLTRTGKFVASVSVSIIEVTDKGELIVQGAQDLEFNNEIQSIELQGRVRPQDISSDNTVISTRVADAKIKYVGDGLLTDRETPGILTRIFNFIF